ncbi:hypothetical protein [Actinomadura sp. B10D3]|uniref:hypothetical protein n=1 Tax=Actinomadura sp. B10D3 TaxID=3153557 RepID=UPI00325D2F59
MPEQSPTRFTMVPARRSSEPTARRRARRILGALFLSASLSVVAVMMSLAKESAEPDLSSVDPEGRDVAYAAAVNFLAGARQDVPHADTFDPEAAMNMPGDKPRAPLDYRSLGWVGFTPQRFGSEEVGFTEFEVHHFLVVLDPPAVTPPQGPKSPSPQSPPRNRGSQDSPRSPGPGTGGGSPAPSGQPRPPQAPAPSGSPAAPSGSPAPGGAGGTPAPPPGTNVLQLDVPVLLDTKGPRLAAAPAFGTWKNGDRGANGRGDYSNYSTLATEVSDAAKNQILLWAKAYATGDAVGLLAITGDQNSGHSYVGLSGFTLPDSPEAVQILSAIRAANDQLIVRVRVRLARAATGGNDAAGQFTTFADFDLLVGGRTGAQPPILAWGPAGSAAELEPYSNAVGD